jgi:hypothetical protein
MVTSYNAPTSSTSCLGNSADPAFIGLQLGEGTLAQNATERTSSTSQHAETQPTSSPNHYQFVHLNTP